MSLRTARLNARFLVNVISCSQQSTVYVTNDCLVNRKHPRATGDDMMRIDFCQHFIIAHTLLHGLLVDAFGCVGFSTVGNL